MLNSIRVKFLRGEEVKFISHLDLLKVFERALRRSHILVSHSQGFNPRPHMVFGLPLSVGITSIAEYADFELNQIIEPKEFVERLNLELPDGLKIIEGKEKQSKINIMASISQASYDISVLIEAKPDIDTLNKRIEEFMKESSVIVKKETKNGIKDVNVKPFIYSLEVKLMENSSDLYCISALLSAGSAANLKPELLINALDLVTGFGIKIAKITRTGLFVDYEGKYLHPLDDGVLFGS